MAAVTVKIQGAAQLARALNELPRRRIKPITRAAVREGANVIRDEARQELRSRGYSRQTYIAPIVQTQRDPTPFSRRALVGYRLRAFWLGFIEEGTGAKRVRVRGAEVLGFKAGNEWITFGERGLAGATPAQPWFRPSFDRNKDKVILTISQALERRIAAEVAKLSG